MTVRLDKSVPVCEFLDATLGAEARFALGLVKLSLEKTAIYTKSTRTSAKELSKRALNRITTDLSQRNVLAIADTEVELAQMSANSYGGKDCADLRVLLLAPLNLNIVIEFDAGRADQVAKKFVSRAAVLQRANLVYIAYCYPGTAKMKLPEVRKYFKFMAELAVALRMKGFIGMAPPRNL